MFISFVRLLDANVIIFQFCNIIKHKKERNKFLYLVAMLTKVIVFQRYAKAKKYKAFV